MLSGGRGVRVRLGKAELAEDLGAILTIGRFFEGATEVRGKEGESRTGRPETQRRPP